MTSTSITIGAPAPAFTLADQDGKPTSLSDLQGRWIVLYFYPKDDTPGCTTEACDFTAGLKDFEALDATVLGCSPDSAASHRKFITKHNLEITLLSDEDHAVMDRYGAWGEKNMYGKISQGVLRSTVLIDPEGKVAHHWKNVKAAGHAEQVRRKLEELQAK
ncbi:MAG: thioredoxin-dependent thiol peroxidase [Candidatus Competibacteraceae bacterium]